MDRGDDCTSQPTPSRHTAWAAFRPQRFTPNSNPRACPVMSDFLGHLQRCVAGRDGLKVDAVAVCHEVRCVELAAGEQIRVSFKAQVCVSGGCSEAARATCNRSAVMSIPIRRCSCAARAPPKCCSVSAHVPTAEFSP